MTKIISYSLFKQTGPKFDRNSHDPLDNKQDRYWLNIPFILLANKYIFKDITTKLYLSSNLKNHRLFPLLAKAAQNLDSFELAIVNRPVVGTEPTLWRMMPLWEKDIEFCFCRDLDSVVTAYEAKIMSYFMGTSFLINNIRTLAFHNGEGTSLMAGLSGYNVTRLKEELPLPKGFDNYMRFYKKSINKSTWGCDQETLINFFIRHRPERIRRKILDIYVQPSPSVKQELKGTVNPNKHYNVVSSDINIVKNNKLIGTNNKIIQFIDSQSTWAGGPINASGAPLRQLINFINDDYCNKMKDIITSNKTLLNFYKI